MVLGVLFSWFFIFTTRGGVNTMHLVWAAGARLGSNHLCLMAVKVKSSPEPGLASVVAQAAVAAHRPSEGWQVWPVTGAQHHN